MAYLIDPVARTVTEVDYDGSLEQAYKLTGCNMIEQAHLSDGNVLLVDEEGLFKSNLYFIIDTYPQPLAGRALMVGKAMHWKKAPSVSLAEVQRSVQFQK